ncbi:MAG: MipA/OmpV family protein, partial [Alphaproteobacteria bacterium]|nr:MipA/OmpV family protein [Alphaproteobacteria bacterium]
YKVGVGANLRYAFTREIGVSLFGRVDRMVGDAANAQIVKERGDRYQGIVGLSVTYSFNF